ncbi:hypothetical protein NMYAN_130072 [Nitrosomonas nitrosa]|uniref:Uncharacterized protein n=1 Tax=Nitrosomonas nitrosa TaxID=52442 RepID=A0A1I4ND72_9PROT|nr:hypothetical protein NMYAN_130072 [Nitrosomonas nitrosa]SFM13448.1 hypothetical protein SAMN05421880_10769 [Nitrosomonas nitrosa]
MFDAEATMLNTGLYLLLIHCLFIALIEVIVIWRSSGQTHRTPFPEIVPNDLQI